MLIIDDIQSERCRETTHSWMICLNSSQKPQYLVLFLLTRELHATHVIGMKNRH